MREVFRAHEIIRVATMKLKITAILLTTILFGPVAFAATDTVITGVYRCASYNVSGGGGSCRNMPTLALSSDGSYRYSSTRGRWYVENGKLVLSDSRLWGPGTVLGKDTVRFEYDYRGWRHVVTWVCQGCASVTPTAAQAPARGKPAKGQHVGVSLTLQFDNAISGVGGFVIVPADAAPGYGHNAPLPEDAVQGLAWETGATTVALATNKNNKLPTGKRYVVFLSWPRETIPVAVLDLPAVEQDYTAVLRASLDGASVIARINDSNRDTPSAPMR